jgi:predicted metal-dependent hydrolase
LSIRPRLRMVLPVSRKSSKIASIIHSLRGRDLDPHYVGFFECFNRQLFFEAHEVLEELWLPQRGKSKDCFYKGLIQLAGAFVHLQKQRQGPALSLLDLAEANLSKYPAVYEALDLIALRSLIQGWREWLKTKPADDWAIEPGAWPKIVPQV